MDMRYSSRAAAVQRLLRLSGHLEGEDEEKDLQLTLNRRVAPRVEDAVRIDACERDALRDLTGEGDACRAGDVANARKHCSAAVLQLGVAEPHQGLVRDGLRDAQRVPDLTTRLLAPC